MSLPPVHAELVDRLVGEMQPVRPRWPPTARLLAWLAFSLTVVAMAAAGGLRRDLTSALADGRLALEMILLTLGAAMLARLALLEAVPGESPSRTTWLVAAGVAAAGLGLALGHTTNTAAPLATFARVGAGCALTTAQMALLPTIALLVLVGRAAPLAPARAGALAGAAAFLLVFTTMRAICALDDGLHLAVWHLGPIVAAIGLAATAGALLRSPWRAS